MSTILDKIIARKHEEIEARKVALPLGELEKKVRVRNYFSIKNSLTKQGASGIIAEFKRRSPSKDWIKKDADSTIIVPAYEKAGASASSILTDIDFFGGNDTDLIAAGEIVKIPLLRKDFMVDEYQVVEANKMGADVILLIAANLTPKRVKELAACANNNNLEVLLEIHNEQELEHICDNVTLVGVNNRNLHTFETSLQNSINLSTQIPDKFIKISESGIRNADDIKMLKTHGFKGFLIGESFMKTNNPGKACEEFIKELT